VGSNDDNDDALLAEIRPRQKRALLSGPMGRDACLGLLGAIASFVRAYVR
jgi:hypothetical protein